MRKLTYLLIFTTLLIIPIIHAVPYGIGEYGCGLFGIGCAADADEPSPPPSPGGDGETIITPISNIIIDPTVLNINLAVNTNVERIITVRNAGDSSKGLIISQEGLEGKIILGTTSLDLEPGETKSFKVIFVALDETGIFTGTLIIDGKTIPVSLNVRSKLLLFDTNIIVLNDDFLVPQGDRLKTQVTLVPLGDKERLDVTLYYVIKDYKGKTYLTSSETLLIEDKIDFNRNFGTGALPLGQYIIGLELVYPNGIAPSSAHFEVVERKPRTIFGKIVFFLIILILIVLIILIILWIKREREKKKQQGVQS